MVYQSDAMAGCTGMVPKPDGKNSVERAPGLAILAVNGMVCRPSHPEEVTHGSPL